MPAFETDELATLKKANRTSVVGVEIIGVDNTTESADFPITAAKASTDVGTIVDGAFMWGPVDLLRIGTFLAGQDYGLYGDSQVSGRLVMENRANAFHRDMVPEITPGGHISDGFFQKNPMGAAARVLLILYDLLTAGGMLARQVGLMTLRVADIEIDPAELSFVLRSMHLWNMEIPFTNLSPSSFADLPGMPTDREKAIPIHFGHHGKGIWSPFVPVSPFDPQTADDNETLFQGWADPIDPAPALLAEERTSDTTLPVAAAVDARGTVLLHDTGIPWSNQGLVSAYPANLYYDVGDGRYGWLGETSGLPTANNYIKTYIATEGTRGNNRQRSIQAVLPKWFNIIARIAVYPTEEFSHNTNWETYTFPRWEDTGRKIFNGLLREAGNFLVPDLAPNWCETVWEMSPETDLGRIASIYSFVIVNHLGPADARIQLETDWRTGTTETLDATITAGGVQMFSQFVGTVGNPSLNWRFAERIADVETPWLLTLRVRAETAGTADIRILCAGLQVRYEADALGDRPGTFRQKVVNADFDVTLSRGKARKPDPPDEALRFFISTNGQVDVIDAGGNGTGVALTNPVAMLWALLRNWGHSGQHTAAVPVFPGTDEDVYGSWGAAVDDLDALLGFYFPTSDQKWRGRYTVLRKDKTKEYVRIFQDHLPIQIFEDREGLLKCSVFFTDTGGPVGQPPSVHYQRAEPLHPQYIRSVSKFASSPINEIKNEIVVRWMYDYGRGDYRYTARLNSFLSDDGFGNDYDQTQHAGYHKAVADASEWNYAGRRTLNIDGITVVRELEAMAICFHALRKFAGRHVYIDIVCDFAYADIERGQWVKFHTDADAEFFGDMPMPYLTLDGDQKPVSIWWWVVVRKSYDFLNESVNFRLRSVEGQVF